MAFDLDLVTSYTPQQLVDACAQARMTLLLGGQSVKMPDGRFIERLTAADIDLIEAAAIEALNPADASTGIVLVNRERAV